MPTKKKRAAADGVKTRYKLNQEQRHKQMANMTGNIHDDSDNASWSELSNDGKGMLFPLPSYTRGEEVGGESSSRELYHVGRDLKNFKFDQFDQAKEEWEYYISRFETELLLFGFDSPQWNRHKSILLLSKIGPVCYKILVDHFKPKNVNDVLFEEMKEVLDRLYSRKVLIQSERREFTLSIRNSNQSVAHYVNTLRAKANRCDFGLTLEERIRDQLFVGINNPEWQRELINSFPTNKATLKDVEAAAIHLEQVSCEHRRLAELQRSVSPKLVEYNEAINNVGDRVKERVSGTNSQQQRKNEKQRRVLVRGKHCFGCGSFRHRSGERCPAEGEKCMACYGKNHFARVCLGKGKAVIMGEGIRKTVRSVGLDKEGESESDEMEAIRNVKVHKGDVSKVMLEITINRRNIAMLYDPGAARTIISERIWKEIGSPRLSQVQGLVAYTGVPIETLGKARVRVEAFNKSKQLELTVVKSNDVPLFGLDWVLEFNLSLPAGAKLCAVAEGTSNKNSTQIEKLLAEFKELFENKLGTIVGYQAKVHISDSAKPSIHKVRPVPLALKDSVEKELERLVDIGVIEPVDPSKVALQWASPIVTVVKPTGKVRICGDFKVSINPYTVLEKYPLPRFEEVTAKLSGGKYYTTIDLKDAYLQLLIEEESRSLLTIATHVGYFRYRRLPFGVNFAPSLFQRTIDQILQGIPGIACFLDDIIVQGKTIEEHNTRLEAVLKRLKLSGVKVQREKCRWAQEQVTYLGHRIDREGIHPTDEHIKAIKEMGCPKNITELRSFLGSINYYSRFVPHLQSMCAPLHQLTKSKTKWAWTLKEEKIFNELKECLSSKDTLVHYNPEAPLFLSCDASGVGLGAVLFHRYGDGIERPIAYASRKLTQAELKYATIEKEGLAIIFGVTKFNHYLFGKKFTVRTDHRPLQFIFGANKEIPKTTANRISRWALVLSEYSYNIEYTKGANNSPADALSRLPIDSAGASEGEELGELQSGHLFHLRLPDLRVTKYELRKETMADETLRKVVKYIKEGWPETKNDLNATLWTYFEKKNELSFEEGVLMWMGRIVVPINMRRDILFLLHEGHPGVTAMKSSGKFYVWWPGIDREIEKFVRECVPCQQTRPKEMESPLFSWTAPSKPWKRIHVDYAGPFQGKFWLIVVDAFSKWLEIFPTTSTSSHQTITMLRQIFSRFGIPASMVSDNGPQFTSGEFDRFCRENGVRHIKSTPYHPRTNGLAERFVRTFKDRMKASKKAGLEVNVALQQFLLSYRNNINRATGRSPAELMIGRRLTTRLDLLKPDVGTNIDNDLVNQKIKHDRKAKERHFLEGDEVWVLAKDGKSYEEGRVLKKTGNLSYRVLVNGQEQRKHADHLRLRCVASKRGGKMLYI